jgi:hypothetical protein
MLIFWIVLVFKILYYAQCAWGTTAIEHNSTVDAATRLHFLSGMLEDCSSLIRLHTSQDKKLKRWFRDLEDRVDEGEVIDDQSMRTVIHHVNDWSGGDRLWQCMRDRIQQSFSELVIVPALIDVFDCYKLLNEVINLESNIKKIGRQEELETKQQAISEGSERLTKEVENIRDQLATDVKTIIKALKTNDSPERSKAEQYLKQKGYEGFFSLLDGVREVEGDLIEQLITPVREAFKSEKGTYELEEELTKVITPPKAKAVAKAYDLVNRKLSKFERDDSGYFIKQVRQDDLEENRSMEHAEKAVRSLYYAMRKAISARAEFTLQGQTNQLETGLQSLVNKLTEELKSVCRQELPDLELDKVIVTRFESYLTQNPPELPEQLFDFASDIQQDAIRKREVVGTKKEQQTYTEGSCFKQEKTRTVTNNVYENIEYQELKLPDYKKMGQQWADGIAQEKEKLWNILDNWISDYLERITQECDRSIDKAIKLTERAFEQQLRLIEQNGVKQVEYWEQFEQELDSLTDIYQQLKQESVTEFYSR